MLEVGLATHLVHHSSLPAVEAGLAALGAAGKAGDLSAVAAMLDEVQSRQAGMAPSEAQGV